MKFWLLLAIAFLSGFAAFLHESIWIRAFGFVLGNSSVSATIVISAFIGGVGLGALWIAPRIKKPAQAYLGLQFLVAIAGLALPWLAMRASIWPGGNGDFFLAFLIIFLSSLAIGGSFPLLFATRSDLEERSKAASFYAVNTAGAVIGASLGAYLGVAALGLIETGILASVVNLLNGVLIFYFGFQSQAMISHRSAETVVAMPKWPMVALFFAGFLTLAQEILLARGLMFFFKGYSLVYAAVISIFLLGLAIGNFLGSGKRLSIEGLRAKTGTLFVLAGIGIVFPLFLAELMGGKGWIWKDNDLFVFYFRLFAITAIFSFPSTIPLGALIPLTYEAVSGNSSRKASRVMFWDSLGSLCAPPLVGLFAIKFFSLTTSFVLLAGLGSLCGVYLLWQTGRKWLIPFAALPCLVFVFPTSLRPFLEKCWTMQSMPQLELLEYKDERDFAVSIVEDALIGERTLLTDSFRAAGTSEDFRYMRGLGHLPILLHPDPKEVCVICFGTGSTAGAVAMHDEVEKIRIVEIAPKVIDYAPYFFDRNRSLFHDGNLDPRASFVFDDGRRFLRANEERFDVITLEPLLPVAPVAVHFYTSEFYELCKSRLKPGGILCQWIPTHAVAPFSYKTFLNTFIQSFPQGSVWLLGETTVLIGGGPDMNDAGFRRQFAKRPRMEFALSQMGFQDTDELLASCLAKGNSFQNLVKYFPPLSDDRPFVEWFSPKTGTEKFSYLSMNLDFLMLFQKESPESFILPEKRAQKYQFLKLRRKIADEDIFMRSGFSPTGGVPLSLFDEFVKEDGPGEALRWRSRVAWVEAHHNGMVQLQTKDVDSAIASFESCTKEMPGAYGSWMWRSAAYLAAGRKAESEESLARAFVLLPRLRETLDWWSVTLRTKELDIPENYSKAESLGRDADAFYLKWRPTWQEIRDEYKKKNPISRLALWKFSVRSRDELQQIFERKLSENPDPEDKKLLSELMQKFSNPSSLNLPE